MHRWKGLSDTMLTQFQSWLRSFADFSRDAHAKHRDEDAENVTVTITATVDGAPLPTISQTGVSYRTVVEVQKYAVEILNDMTNHGNKTAAAKREKKHGKH